MKKRCRDYVGVACVNGRCPAAIREKYEEECIPVVIRCHNCFFIEAARIVLWQIQIGKNV